MIELLGKVAGRMAERRLVRVLNNGFARLVPFITIGAIVLALLNLPIPALHALLDQSLGGGFYRFAELLTASTFSIITLAALCSISISYTLEYVNVYSSRPYLFVPMFTSLACFVIIFVWQDGSLNFLDIGANGIFKAILISLSSLRLLFWLTRRTGHGLEGFDANLSMHSAFASLLPVALTLSAFALLRLGADAVLAATDVKGLIYTFIIQTEADNFVTIGLMILVSQLLAFFGAHNFVVFDFIPSIDMVPTLNAAPLLFSVRGYYLQFALVGGSGATLGLLLALLLFNRGWYKGQGIARASLLPMLFNINEPLLYGFPVMLNPFYFIPFIAAPLLSAALSYLAFWLKLVPPITMMADWTVPPLLSGYLSTGSLNASVLQAVCIVTSVAIYYPFVRAHRRYELEQRQHRFALMQEAAAAAADELEPPVTYRDDSLGELAREYAGLLLAAARQGRLPFYMAYQPKTDRHGRVVGSEGLLRWHDAEMGDISPVTAVELMEEAGQSVLLGRWVIERSLSEFAQMRRGHLTDMRVSINLDPRHLARDDSLVAYVTELRDRFVILPGEVEFEITEHAAVQATEAMHLLFAQLRDLGFGLSIDDLGMGYSSLNYISEYGVHTVKVDASLVKDVAHDHKQRGIVSSIVQLTEQLKLELVVEGVETIEQVEALSDIGVEVFRFYFSRPLSIADFQAYYAEHS